MIRNLTQNSLQRMLPQQYHHDMELQGGNQPLRSNSRGTSEIINNSASLNHSLALVSGCKSVQPEISITYSNDDSSCKSEKAKLPANASHT